MNNWDLVYKSYINIVKKMYKKYKTKEGTYIDDCYNRCVVTCCRESEFREHMYKECSNRKCYSCWNEFMEFLDKEAKKSNMEVYDNE